MASLDISTGYVVDPIFGYQLPARSRSGESAPLALSISAPDPIIMSRR